MSVTEVIAQLRQAHALLTQARQAIRQADTAIADGADVFATATLGSTQPEVDQINHLAARSADEVRAAHALLGGAQEIIDGYSHHLAGHGIDDAGPTVSVPPSTDDTTTRPPPATGPPPTADEHTDPQTRYAAEIAELRRNGTKISPEKVVRVGRHQDGYLVWLEEGRIDTSGKAHILRPNRRKFFEREGVPAARVVDLIFAGIERGRLIGHMVDKEVYEVDFDGTPRRQIAIFISPNGYIVTALPVTSRNKVALISAKKNEN